MAKPAANCVYKLISHGHEKQTLDHICVTENGIIGIGYCRCGVGEHESECQDKMDDIDGRDLPEIMYLHQKYRNKETKNVVRTLRLDQSYHQRNIERDKVRGFGMLSVRINTQDQDKH